MKLGTVIIVLVTAGLTGTAFWGYNRWRNPGGKPSGDAQAISVRLAKVERGDLSEVIQAAGEVQPRTKVSISAEVSARIMALPYAEGTTVTAGNDTDTSPSILVQLDATNLSAAVRSTQARYAAQQSQIKVSEARIEAARSSLQVQEINLRDAERELDRERNLMRTKNTSQVNYDQATRKVEELRSQLDASRHSIQADEASLTASRHTLEAAEAEIARAKEDLSNATIVSPIDGIVTRVNGKVGELAMTGTMNNPGTVILEVADLSEMRLVARIDEANIAAVKVGQPAKVYMQAFQDRVFEGRVYSVALASQEKDKEKNFTCELLLDMKGERIPSGLSGDADIETSRHTGVLKVPSQAVLGRPIDDLPADVRNKLPAKYKDQSVAPVVCRFAGGKSDFVPVDVGASDNTHTIVKSGLSENDKIVIGPYKVLDTLKHAAALKDDAATTATTTTLTAKPKA